MDEREIRRYKLWKKIKSYHELVTEIQARLNIIKGKMMEAKFEYESLDRELMMEKRTVVAPQGEPKKRVRTVGDLTIKEVQSIAAKLGVKLDIKDN